MGSRSRSCVRFQTNFAPAERAVTLANFRVEAETAAGVSFLGGAVFIGQLSVANGALVFQVDPERSNGTIDAAKKYVVSSTLDRVDWNAELVRGDLGKAVQKLKGEAGKGLFVGGVKLPMALAELGLIDEYEFVVHPRLAGHGPTLFAGLSKYVDLKLVSRLEFGSGAVAMRYEPRR